MKFTASLAACTVATRAQLPSVRVVCDSLRAQHADAELAVLVLDRGDDSAPVAERVRALSPDALGLPRDLFGRLALACAADELADALTPWLVRMLVEQGAAAVVALRPETDVFAPLDDIVELAVEHGIVLVPRTDGRVPDDGLEPDAGQARAAGPFADFVAVGGDAMSFLAWWQERQVAAALSRRGLADAGPWTAQVPAAFPCHVLRDPGCGASAWNLHSRELRATNGGYEVSGAPLRWFDFTGYSPDAPHLLTTAFHLPRVRLGDNPDLARLCDEHGARLREAGYADAAPEYGFDALPGRREIDGRMRRIYRDALNDAVEDGDEEPPSPFDGDAADDFAAWVTEPVAPPIDPVVSRYLARVREEQPELLDAFPSIAGEGAEAYFERIRAQGPDLDVPEWLLPTEQDLLALIERRWRARPSGPRPRGVNVVGYVTAVVGVGHVARVLASSLHTADVRNVVVANQETTSQKSLPFETRRAGDANFDVNLLCVNADHMELVARQLGPEFFGGRGTIGVWFWEVEDFPSSSIEAFDLVDEVWVASDFVFESIAPVAPKPVRKFPLPVVVPPVPVEVTRADFGLPDERFVFLFVYDFLSTAERKNPLGLIDAYTRAFDPDDGAVLVLKSINGEKRIDQLERVRRTAEARPDIHVLDTYLSPDLHAALLAHSDAFVSLHRSEGFGLDLAAAMGLGKPVIATRYSGNLEFMDDDTAYLVDYDLVPVGAGNDPYPPDSRWAQPRADHGAALMRRVVERPDEARERGRRAAARIANELSLEARSTALASMVDTARSRPAPQGSWRRFFSEGWRAERHEEDAQPDRPYWLPDGTPVDRTMRRLLASDAEATRLDPEADLASFYELLNERVFPPNLPVVSRYLYELWCDRADLRTHFPDIEVNPQGYLEWLVEHGHADTDVPYRLLPTRDDLQLLAEYQKRQERRARLTRAVRAAGQRVAGLVNRR
jgi:glycosyltransferase involved in cell wall biosynthesis